MHARLWLIRLMLVQLCLVVCAMTVVRAQLSDLAMLERRVYDIDKDLSGRVKVLESDMAEVKWLSRAVTAAVIGQLVIAGMGMKERKRGAGL